MRIVVLGATGNVGLSLLGELANDERVESVTGIARRIPENLVLPKVTWRKADITTADLDRIFEGADAVVHLAWLIQPSHEVAFLHHVNVEGSRRVFDAVARQEVPALIYASSIGAYSPAPKDPPVDEQWPTGGIHSSVYSMQKAAVERLLDDFERRHPQVRTVRLRPGLIFKGEAASEICRYFLGSLVPVSLLRWRRLPLVPDVPQLRTQAVHTSDVAEAYRLAITQDVRGAFNIASEPVIDASVLAPMLHARRISMPAGLIRGLAEATWRLHLQPTAGGWVDMGLLTPIMNVDRARDVLGWKPEITAGDALRELIEGLAHHRGSATPPLQRNEHTFR